MLTRRPTADEHFAMLPSQVVDASYDFVAKNQNLVRSLPLWAGGLGFVCLLANRTLSGVRMVL
jgi:hypothetical protein